MFALALFGIVLAVLGYRRWSVPAGVDIVFSGNSQLSTGPGLEVNAAFSPVGSLVAYASDRSGSFEIYVRTLVPGSLKHNLPAMAAKTFTRLSRTMAARSRIVR